MPSHVPERRIAWLQNANSLNSELLGRIFPFFISMPWILFDPESKVVFRVPPLLTIKSELDQAGRPEVLEKTIDRSHAALLIIVAHNAWAKPVTVMPVSQELWKTNRQRIPTISLIFCRQSKVNSRSLTRGN